MAEQEGGCGSKEGLIGGRDQIAGYGVNGGKVS